MATEPANRPFLSIEDYLAGEQDGETRHEYIDGIAYAMTGASRRHGLIVNALAYHLTPLARQRRCQLFTNDMKVRLTVIGKTMFYYPDLLLTCNAADIDPYYSESPSLIVEVASPSTTRVDHREKLLSYITIPSLQDYLVVEQDKKLVEVYRRANEWMVEEITAGDIGIDCLDTHFPIDAIYMDLE